MKAFDRLQSHLISDDPSSDGKRVLFYKGGNADAKARIGALIDQLGCFGIDLGQLSLEARLVQSPRGPLPEFNLVRIG